jgi:hypothetical protein
MGLCQQPTMIGNMGNSCLLYSEGMMNTGHLGQSHSLHIEHDSDKVSLLEDTGGLP